DN
ncbi:hypothetical protein D039_2860B, partial [Vibrio parahaemolyticus EKP-028]